MTRRGWWLALVAVAGCVPAARPGPQTSPAAGVPSAASAASSQSAALAVQDAAALLATGVPAAHLTAADIGVLPTLGSVHQGGVSVLGRNVKLPDGAWLVVAELLSTYPGYPPGARIVLLRREGARMTGLLEIGGNALSRPARAGFPPGPACDAAARAQAAAAQGGPGTIDGLLLADGGAPERPGCVVVAKAATGGWQDESATPPLRAAASAMARLGVAVPPRVRVASFSLADRRYRLNVTLWLDASADGSSPEPDAGRPGPAAADETASDAGLVRWALGWRPLLASVLDRAGAALPDAGVARIHQQPRN